MLGLNLSLDTTTVQNGDKRFFFCLQSLLSKILAGHLKLSGLSWMKGVCVCVCVTIKINIYSLQGFVMNSLACLRLLQPQLWFY